MSSFGLRRGLNFHDFSLSLAASEKFARPAKPRLGPPAIFAVEGGQKIQTRPSLSFTIINIFPHEVFRTTGVSLAFLAES